MYAYSNPRITSEHLKKQEHVYREIRKAIKDGILIRPETCSLCSLVKKKIEGHHRWGYEKENLLRVVWVCRSCHDFYHKLEKYGRSIKS
jgi:hypothetical protein